MTSLSAFFQKACGVSVYKSTFFLQKALLACSVAFISSVSLLTPVANSSHQALLLTEVTSDSSQQ